VHKQKVIDKAGNDKEVVNILTSDYIRNASDVHHNNDLRHSGSGVVSFELFEWCIFRDNTPVQIIKGNTHYWTSI